MKNKISRSGKKECYHCKKRLSEKERKTHNCWSKTESELTQELAPELLDAWEKIREAASDFGEQRIYASHRSIMFSRKSCYFFVRPTKKRLEVCFFAGRRIEHSRIRKVHPTSKTKYAHLVYVLHGDEIESPLTEWLKEAYDFCSPQKAEKNSSEKHSALVKKKVITFRELTKA